MSQHPDLSPADALPIPNILKPAEKKVTVVERVDRLEAELLQTQMQNVQYQLQLMQHEMTKALDTRNTLMQRMVAFRETFQAKYGADLAQVTIQEDGTLVPVGAPR